jgi:hypothetical protein
MPTAVRRQRKRPNPFLSRARSYWRLSKKKRNEGDQRSSDWYAWQAQVAYNKYQETVRQ